MPRVNFMPFKCQTAHNFSRRAFLFQCSHLFPRFSIAASQALPSSDVVSVTSILTAGQNLPDQTCQCDLLAFIPHSQQYECNEKLGSIHLGNFSAHLHIADSLPRGFCK